MQHVVLVSVMHLNGSKKRRCSVMRIEHTATHTLYQVLTIRPFHCLLQPKDKKHYWSLSFISWKLRSDAFRLWPQDSQPVWPDTPWLCLPILFHSWFDPSKPFLIHPHNQSSPVQSSPVSKSVRSEEFESPSVSAIGWGLCVTEFKCLQIITFKSVRQPKMV